MNGPASRLTARPGSFSGLSKGCRGKSRRIEALDRPAGAIYNRAHD